MNPYEVLEIPPGATPEEVKAAYHRMAKQWHPDRFTGEAKADAERRFRMLAEAFSLLKNSARKAEPAPDAATVPQASAQAQAQAPPQQIQLDQGPGGDASGKPKSADEWYADAKGAYEGKAFGRALALVLYALRLDKDRAEFHALHGKVLEISGGDPRAKVKALETAVQLNPKDVESLILLARNYQNLGMQARATKLWERVRNLAPNHPMFKGAAGKKNGQGNEARLSLGEQFSTLVAEARVALNKLFKRG